MWNASRWVGVVLVCVILLSAGAVSAQDWPQWRGANRDGKATGFAAPDAWPKALTEKWKVSVGLGDGGPAVVGDKIYVFARQGDEEVTLCLDANGKEVWKDKYPAAAISGPDARAHTGPRSTPTVAEGKVITLGVNGVLSCLDAAKGTLVWRKEEYKGTPQFHTSMSPLVVDGLCIAHLGGASSGALVALDLAKGEEKWKWAVEGPSYSSPVLLTAGGVKQVVVMTDKSVVGIGASDGRLLWQLPFAPAGRMGYNAATPVIDGETVILTGGGRGTKAYKIEKDGDKFAAKEAWSNDKTATQFSTPVLKDGLLFGMSEGKKLFCLSVAKKGETAWTDSANRSQYGEMLDAGSVVMALADNGELVVFKPSAEKYDEVAKFTVGKGTFGSPVVCGKKILVKDQDSLVLWSLE